MPLRCAPLVLSLTLLLIGPAGGLAQSFAPGELAAEIEATQAAFPDLLHLRDTPGGRTLTGVGDSPLHAIYSELEAGRLAPEAATALRVALVGLSRQTGTVAVEGRQILQAIAGIAAESGSRDALLKTAAILSEIADDGSNAYGLLAQDLLSEKIRCGAAALGDHDLVRSIAAQVDPDRFGLLTEGQSRALADRYGLHRAADLYSVDASGMRAAVVGSMGTLLLSDDGGDTWAAAQTGTDQPLYGVAFAPAAGAPQGVWAVGREGTVLFAEGPARVVLRPTPFDRHFFGVVARPAGGVRVVGDFGLQLASDDQGRSWRCVPREQDVILGRIARAGDDAFLVGEFGTVERLPARDLPGSPGSIAGVPDDLYLFDVWFDERGRVGLAVGLSGTVLRSEDGGATWQPVDSGLEADLYGVGGAGNQVIVVGEGGTIARSEDGGRSFARLEAAVPPIPFHDVAFADAQRAFFVGPRGFIGRLRDGAVEVVHP